MIYHNLKNIRLDQKISQEELAYKMQALGVNMDQQMISKIERNKRIVTDYELVCLCKILKITLEELLEM